MLHPYAHYCSSLLKPHLLVQFYLFSTRARPMSLFKLPATFTLPTLLYFTLRRAVWLNCCTSTLHTVCVSDNNDDEKRHMLQMFWPPCCKVLKDTWLYFFSLLQGALSDLSKRIHSCAVFYMQSCIFFWIFADADIDTGALGEQSWAEVAAMGCFHSGFNYRHGWEFYGLGHNISNPEK